MRVQIPLYPLWGYNSLASSDYQGFSCSSRHTSAGCVVEAARNILCNVGGLKLCVPVFYRVILGIAASHARFPELGNVIMGLNDTRGKVFLAAFQRLWLAAVVCIALLVIKKCEHFVALLTNLTPVVWGGIGVR
ncbi:hypothetical protein CUMW_198530 [Citrus unshiu]|nr:hypothetical protein CUMW_198530 [Citrus unshiu]